MKTEEQNRAIAEACGVKPELVEWWAYCHDDTGGAICMSAPTKDRVEEWIAANPDYGSNYFPKAYFRYPRYTECLNACAEMEKALGAGIPRLNKVIKQYRDELCKIIGCAWYQSDQLIQATAPQRCEAFLKVKGLWTETPTPRDDEK